MYTKLHKIFSLFFDQKIDYLQCCEFITIFLKATLSPELQKVLKLLENGKINVQQCESLFEILLKSNNSETDNTETVNENNFELLFAKAKQCIQMGNYQVGEQLYNECIEKYPEKPHAYGYLAFYYHYKKNDLTKAIPLYKKVISKSLTGSNILKFSLKNLAIAYESINDYRNSKINWNKYLSIVSEKKFIDEAKTHLEKIDSILKKKSNNL